jgi:cysteine-rich repeat protein
MTRTSVRIALCLSLLSWCVAGCSGSDDESLNTHNIGRTDAASLVPDEDAGEDAGEEDGGEGEDASGEGEGDQDAEVADAGDFDAIVSVEVADAGPAPDTTVVTETALCGNGKLDTEEQCDQGADNSDSKPGACRTNCRRARCGDSVVDEGEACDQGAANSDSAADACRSDCRAHRCGDNVVDQGEQCDTGDARSDTAAGACRLTCRSARCGDGVRDTDEGCDDGNTVDTDACRNNCRSARCGDGVVDPDEECDDGNTVNSDSCRDTCRRPICGDRVVDPGEQCDDGNQVNNDGCRSNCRTGCVNDAGCSDNLFCTGVERCVDGLCNPGVGINPDDNIGCTMDVCREDLGRVVHTPNDALCPPPAPTCNAARGTTSTATCDVTRGCVVRSTTTACSDQASACELRGDGSYTLATYTPACEDNMSCGDPAASSRVCAHVPASCNNRVFTSRADATCNPNTETCGNRTPTTDDCRTRDSSSCAADNRTFTRVTGTCSTTGGCGSSPSNSTCSDPADTCTSPTQLTTYTPTCDPASGCGTASASTQTCGANAAVCSDGPNVRAASIVRYQPSCSGSACVAGGVAQQATLCPANAATCSNGASTSYRPTCQSATACVPGGSPTTTPCPIAPTTCGTDNTEKRPALTIYSASCQDGQSCSPTGSSRLEYCALTPITCSGTTETRPGRACANNQCAPTTRDCPTTQYNACANTSTLELRRGTCRNGEGCAYDVLRTSPCAAPTCGQVAGAAVWQRCASTCGVNSDGVTGCNSSCQQCASPMCERAATTGALTGRVCGGCGTDANGVPICRSATDCVTCSNGCNANTNACNLIIVGQLGGVGTLGGVISGAVVAPGAGVVSQ